MHGPDKSKPTIFRADAALVAQFQAAAEKVLPAERIHRGLIATGDVFVSERSMKLELRGIYMMPMRRKWREAQLLKSQKKTELRR